MLGDSPSTNLVSVPRHTILAALLTLVVFSVITAWAWWNASKESMQDATERFEFKVNETRFAIEQRLLAYEQVLRGGIGLFAASDVVTRDEWHTYVSNLRIESQYPGIQGIGFAKWVNPAERESLERSVQAEGYDQFHIWPVGERDIYTAILYLEPFDWRNQRAFGYDMYSEPVRHEAMERARNTGQPAASGIVMLVQETETDVQNGFLMYLPLYRPGVPTETVAQRRAAIMGFVYAPFRMNNLMRGIRGEAMVPILDLEIYDGEHPSPDNLVYDGDPDHTREMSALSNTSAIEFGGRRWTLQVSSLPALDATIGTQKPRLILGSGLLISLLFAAIVWALLLNRHRARALTKANRGLQAEIIERSKLEKALEGAKNVAEAASQAKSEFLANVSHELRTPLTLILAPLDQLLQTVDPAATQCRKHLERAQRNALLLFNRVNDILDFAKAEARRFEPRWERVDLTDLIPGLVNDAFPVADSQGCALTWKVDPALNAVVVDRHHFEKILMNLVSNALKFTPSGGQISVTAAVFDGNRFELAVEDSGLGIPADKQSLIFERFQQVDNSATRQCGGTGIGLALVKELTELMDGTVTLESEVGKGSRFCIRLPIEPEGVPIPESVEPPVLVEALESQGASLRRMRFMEHAQETAPGEGESEPEAESNSLPVALVADDNPDLRTYIAELLQDICTVHVVSDGEQAWKALYRYPIDVVITDVMMPKLDGLRLTARIKASQELSRIPVLLLTARGGIDASVSGFEVGADDYLAKPFSPPELRARVCAALRMAQIQAQLRERSHEAGMATIATGILHNLGNVLNGVTVSSGLIVDQLQRSKVPSLGRLTALFEENADNLPEFIARDPQGQAIPEFLAQLSRQLETERHVLLQETEDLRSCVKHALGVINTQKRVASKSRQLRELVSAEDLMETALKLSLGAFRVGNISVVRDYRYDGPLSVDRYKVLQILLNLLANAQQAMQETPETNRRVFLRISRDEEWVRLEVEDTGRGIPQDNLPLLFNQGFSTHAESGHGYGLHSSANWAKDLGGTLVAHSDGPGRGASFVLKIPLSGLECSESTGTLPVGPKVSTEDV